MFNSAMQIPPQNPYMGQTLPDDTDRISGMMGFDVNGYVFGNQNINNQTQPIQTHMKPKKEYFFWEFCWAQLHFYLETEFIYLPPILCVLWEPLFLTVLMP